MTSEVLELKGEGFEALVEGHTDGEVRRVVIGGMTALEWRCDDRATRDVIVAASLQSGHKGTTVASLTGTSPAHVSRVAAVFRRGGFRALVLHATGTPRTALDPDKRSLAIELREQGMSFDQIAVRVGVARTIIGRLLRGVPAGPRVAQLDLAARAVDVAGEDDLADDVDEVTADDEASAPDAAWEEAAEGPAEEHDLTSCEVLEGDVPHGGNTSQELSRVAPAGEPESGGGAELLPGVALLPAEHESRYAGTILLAAVAQHLGLDAALLAAAVQRPEKSAYPARTAILALIGAWTAGFSSIEAMHERDARAMGVALGLERSPSVRTLHRALAQMEAGYDPVKWASAWMSRLAEVMLPSPRVFGVDGHFKAYGGDEPIDKGYDTKRRLAHKGLMTIRVMDGQGCTWVDAPVAAGDHLHKHLVEMARRMMAAVGAEVPLVLGFDRGGFSFPVLNALAVEVYYLAWVPSTVSLPTLSEITPERDGVGERLWTHEGLDHPARLLVERDGDALLPAATNLPTLVPAAEAMRLLRQVRGWEENGIKAARAFAHIDHLEDRGGAARRPDDRLVKSPAVAAKRTLQGELRTRAAELQRERLMSKERAKSEVAMDELVNAVHQRVVKEALKELPKKVPRVSLDPSAERAELKTRHRVLVTPLKNATDNSRRWLLEHLGAGLSPSDSWWDQDTRNRTLCALLRTGGRVALTSEAVEVTLSLPLPPLPHRRLAEALAALDCHGLRFTDGVRPVRFRLAPRPTRDDLPVR